MAAKVATVYSELGEIVAVPLRRPRGLTIEIIERWSSECVLALTMT